MYSFLAKLRKLPGYLRWHLIPSRQEDELARYLKAANVHGRSTSGSALILIQCVEDAYYYGLFGQIISSLRRHCPIRAEQFVLRSLTVGESRSAWIFLRHRFSGLMFNFRWVRLYRSFCDGVGYGSTSRDWLGDVADLYQAWRCWKRLASRNALLELRIRNIPVGDLINDSFLRCKPSPTIDLRDGYLWIVIWQAFRDIRRGVKYFERSRPVCYLTSYSTYVQHGIAVRIALQYGVKVISFGNLQEFAKELSLHDWFHTRNTDAYAESFEELGGKAEKLAQAEAALSMRLAGGIDAATAYMKRSAYAPSEEPVPEVAGCAIIFLHDFYDSPHVYRDMVFPDFWEWACFTIATLQSADIPFFVKPHPNQIGLSGGALDELKIRYPGMRMISSKITNKQLAEAGVKCAITVYGTVAHEMAFMGVPSIGCARHPHISFDFCKTAKSRDEYGMLLKNCLQLDQNEANMRRQSMIFYYMHNLSLNKEIQELKNAILGFQMACAEDNTRHDLAGMLKAISGLAGFQEFIAKLI